MKQLNTLFKYIRSLNSFAIPEFVNEDSNYYYFKIGSSYVTEVSKESLFKLSGTDYLWEAKDILKNY